MEDYNHISFRKQWEITEDSAYMLGECHSLIHALTDIPLQPEDREKLLGVSLRKGAQATTAIEGNTLSEKEIEKIQEGWRLPPSKEYLQTEVNNILEAFNSLLFEIVAEDKASIITPELIKHFHYMIGKDLGEHFDAIPGRFHEDRRHVGPYLTPDHKYVPELIKSLCDWLPKEFHYNDGQGFRSAVIQAIVTHVYIEWIHPFGDGNGRTGRLLEFLHSASGWIAKHRFLISCQISTILLDLSIIDNSIKPEIEGVLTEFIRYALQGFRDGLKENLDLIQKSQFSIFWRHYIYENTCRYQIHKKRRFFKRKRALILQIPIDQTFLVDELMVISPDIAKKYAKVGRATVLRDLKELQDLNLLKKAGRNYMANTGILKAMMPGKKA